MKKTSSADAVRKAPEWDEKWAIVIYGDPLYKSDAVKALEAIHPTVGLWQTLIYGDQTELEKLARRYGSMVLAEQFFVDPNDKQAVPEYVKFAMHNHDADFFEDLAKAIRRSQDPALKNHRLVMGFCMGIENDLRLKKRDVPTYAELREIAPGADISTIAQELDLVNRGYLRHEKRGPKSRKKKSEK